MYAIVKAHNAQTIDTLNSHVQVVVKWLVMQAKPCGQPLMYKQTSE